MTQLLAVPVRRDVNRLKLVLGTATQGSRITVLCQTSRYGAYIFDGNVAINEFDDMYVGTHLIGGKLETAPKTGEPVRKPTDLLRDFCDPFDVEATETELARPVHGDLVHLELEHAAYGKFTITGVATDTVRRDQLCVGDWIIYGDASIIARAGKHDTPVPPLRPPLNEAA